MVFRVCHSDRNGEGKGKRYDDSKKSVNWNETPIFIDFLQDVNYENLRHRYKSTNTVRKQIRWDGGYVSQSNSRPTSFLFA